MQTLITLILIISAFAVMNYFVDDKQRTHYEKALILKNTGFNRIG